MNNNIFITVCTASIESGVEAGVKSHLQRPEIIIIIAVIAFCAISKFGLKIGYLSIKDIIKNHIDCFRNSGNGKIMIVPVIDYLVIPFMIGLAAALIKVIDSDMINIITIIVSILTSMLFTLLGMIIDMKSKINDNPNYFSTESEISKRSLIETYYTIMFEILVSVVLLVLCLFNVFTQMFGTIQSFLIYSLTFLLIINLMLIIKRIFRVIDIDMTK